MSNSSQLLRIFPRVKELYNGIEITLTAFLIAEKMFYPIENSIATGLSTALEISLTIFMIASVASYQESSQLYFYPIDMLRWQEY